MHAVERERVYIRKWRKLAMGGNSMAMMNVAASYRLLGNMRRAFFWYKRAADLEDGDAAVEVGYCYHCGTGVRRDANNAENAYRSAISSKYITQSGREEAMYGLAVLLLAKRPHGGKREAVRLLRRANADNDYPQAGDLLERIRRGNVTAVCVCRRDLLRRVARRSCPVHRRRAKSGLVRG